MAATMDNYLDGYVVEWMEHFVVASMAVLRAER
jgi:hypothetical protein